MALPRLAVLVSGRGRNLQAILDAAADGRIPARVSCVACNRPDAEAIQRARRAGVPVEIVSGSDHAERAAYDAALAAALDRHRPDFLAMAGFMRVLGPGFIARYAGRMLNIHPSLLPKYRGLHTHRRVLEANDREHGATVHFVTDELDGGPMVIQGRFSIGPQDDEATLAQRAMNEIELKIYPQALAWLARGDLHCADGAAHFRGRRLAAPLTLDDLEPAFR